MNWYGIVHTALARFNGRAKADDFFEFVGRHPKAARDPEWKNRIQRIFESRFGILRTGDTVYFSPYYMWDNVQSSTDGMFEPEKSREG